MIDKFKTANAISIEAVFNHYGHNLKSIGGGKYKTRSPFSEDKTASLIVYAPQNTWWCYSTNQGSTVIDFIVARDGCEPLQALKKAYQIGNITYKETRRQQQRHRAFKQALNKQDPQAINQLDAILDVLKWWSKDDPSLNLMSKAKHYQGLK